jgi:Uma2 family endonuclease
MASIASEPVRFTRAEYHRLVDENNHIELVNGLIVYKSDRQLCRVEGHTHVTIGPKHSATVSLLADLLFVGIRGQARVRIQQPIVIDDFSEPEPDIAIVSPGNYWQHHPTEALLIIEVSDTSLEADRAKAELYVRVTPEYWIVDIQGRAIEVYDSSQNGEYTRVRRYGLDEVVVPDAVPGISISVQALFPAL